MARFINTTTGVVVNVADSKAGRFGHGYKRISDDGPAPATASRGKARAKAAAPAPAPAADPAPASDYSAQKVDDLKAEIARRNEGRDEGDQLPATGNKSDLVAALEADDAASAGE